MKKMTFVPGQRIKGYGIMNEFGEFDFIPSEIGSREGAIKEVCRTKEFTMTETKNYIVLHIKVDKAGGIMDRVRSFLNVTNDVIARLSKYDF